MNQRSRLVDAALLLVALIWGSNFAITKGALAEIHPTVFNVLRIAFSLVFLSVVMFATEGFSLRNIFPKRKGIGRFLSIGFVGNFLFQMFFIYGLFHTTAGNAALFAATAPVWTAVTGKVTGQETVSSKVWLGILITIIGAAVIAFFKDGGLSFSSNTLFGDGIILLSAMSWGCYTSLCRPYLKELSPNRLALNAFLPIYPLLVLVSIPYWPGTQFLMDMSTGLWAAIVFSGLFSTGLAYVLWNWGINRVGPSQTAVYGNVVPIIAIAIGYFYLAEQIQIEQIFGGALILLGLMTARSAKTKKP